MLLIGCVVQQRVEKNVVYRSIRELLNGAKKIRNEYETTIMEKGIPPESAYKLRAGLVRKVPVQIWMAEFCIESRGER